MNDTLEIATSKEQIGIKIPAELDNLLENHVRKIGISKPAFILELICKELSKVKKAQDKKE